MRYVWWEISTAGTDATHAMRELGSSGVWELFIPGVEAGTIYKYEILNANNEWVMKADDGAFA